MAEEDSKPDTETNTEKVAIPAKKKNNKTLWIIIGVVLVLFIVLPAILVTAGGFFLKDKLSSDNITESIIEGASGGKVDVDSDDGNVNIESEDGSSSIGYGDDQELPKDFPKDKIPYIDEKKVTFVITTENENKSNWSVTTTVDKSYEDTVAYFEERIKSPEYTETSNYGFGQTKTFYGKSDTFTLTVSVSKLEDGETSVTYNVGEEQPHSH